MSTAPRIEDILDLSPNEAIERMIRDGFSPESIPALQRFLDVNQTELAEAVGVTRQTLVRNRDKSSPLTKELSDRLYRVARVTRQAMTVFSTDRDAVAWLKSSNATLGGRTPLSMLDTDAGAERVRKLLGRIEYGVLS